MAYRIFVSHNNADWNSVSGICRKLEGIGVQAYTYEEDPQPGTYVADKVKQRIKDSDAVLVLLTKKGASSAYVQEEIGAAEMADRLIIPLVEKGVQKKQLGMLEGKERISFDPKAPDEGMAALVPFVESQALNKKRREIAAGVIAAAMAVLIGYALLVGADES